MEIISKKNARYLKIFLIVFFLLVEVCLVYSLASEKIAIRKKNIKYCAANCYYSPNFLRWKFYGEDTMTGFLTQNECLDYCLKVKNGLTPNYFDKLSASLLKVFNFNR